ncbi:hypothetical protein JYP49_21820 [Nitratireductor aquimarinus]|uniref:hypothetical protein n=1 Tax=Nitratireductor TaxID=245876 RepID=UPI0019D3C81A|nr:MULTISPECIES: hypothetical protein [Nitratireductor]MBN7778898.1 hypothetical protein [Nitratireductor pacificus]MBN7783235.1 hypothetical protein [Nitratireductor pacificus]MBN7792036.1 hypothetical protein [Nitratireductor aquimarinus]MBY6101283.1 hypothetical protein [Nitratireductor aquimarinus]MCA1262570.1 hypothetical protein [Nitratireductor aquimarinus]
MEVYGYTVHGSIDASIEGDRITIPDDPANRHRRMVADWQAEGNTIPAYAPPALTDEEKRAAMPPLSARQLRLGLIDNGITLASVQAAVDGIADTTAREMAQVEWEYATTFERTHALISQIGAALSLTPEEIDTMWEAAGAL